MLKLKRSTICATQCFINGAHTLVYFSNGSGLQASTMNDSSKNYKGLDSDATWEADVLRHERDVDRSKKQNLYKTNIPEFHREKKVKNLPHLSFRDEPQFVQEQSVLDETSDLLLGKTVSKDITAKELDSIVNIDPVFAREDVQMLLQRIHYRCSSDQVYKTTVTERKEMPKVRYLTDEQLKEEMENIKKSIIEKIKMPLVMLKREACSKSLAIDDVLDGYEDSNVSFIDVSENIPNRDRFIVVREPNGNLRYADWSERDRLINLYYPVPGRRILPPLLFNRPFLKNVFEQKNHENALDQCIIQFEPDSKQYIKCFTAVYKNINEQKLYHLLRATRYFGGLVYFLTKKFDIDGIILDMLQRNMIEDAADCVRLLTLIHPDCKTKSVLDSSDSLKDVSIIEAYIGNDSSDKENLSFALKYQNNQTSASDNIVSKEGIP